MIGKYFSRAFLFVSILCLALVVSEVAFASVIITIGSQSGKDDETLSIPIAVDNPVGIAGAAFTITFDDTALDLTGIQTSFFDTFANQWAELDPTPDPLPPSSVVLDDVSYDQPMVNKIKSGAGMMVAAARCTGEIDSTHSTLFLMQFRLKDGATAGTYPVEIEATVLDNEDAGYTTPIEIPMLVGIDSSKAIDDPDAYPVIQASVVQGSITFETDDSDGDGVPDSEDGCPNDPDKTEPGTCGCGVADADSDGDGVMDCNDNCPSDPEKTEPGTCGCGLTDVDTDTDGTSDCLDNDDDDDGMPDEWENRYGLDPLADDAGDDPDRDGYTNLQEYQAGTNPVESESQDNKAMPWIPLLLLE